MPFFQKKSLRFAQRFTKIFRLACLAEVQKTQAGLTTGKKWRGFGGGNFLPACFPPKAGLRL